MLLTEAVAATGPGGDLSAALAPWRKPLAVHDPAKVLTDVAITLVTSPRRTGRAMRELPGAPGILHRFSIAPQRNRYFRAQEWKTPQDRGGKRQLQPPTSAVRIDDAHSPPRKASIMNPFRILVTTTLAAGTLWLSAGAASAATPAPEPMPGQHVSDCARTMGFSGTHNPAIMRQGMPGMDMDMTTSPLS